MSAEIKNTTGSTSASTQSSNESYTIFIEKKIQVLLNQPKERIQLSFVEIYKELDGDLGIILDILFEITKDDDILFHKRIEVFSALCPIVYFSEVMEKALLDEPITFMRLVSYIENENQRQSIINYIIDRNGNQGFSKLIDLIRELVNTIDDLPSMRITTNHLIRSIELRHMKQLALQCVEELPCENFSTLIASLEDYERCTPLITRFFTRYFVDSDMREKAIKNFVETSVQLSNDDEGCPIPLCALLDHRTSTSWVKNVIIRQLDKFDSLSQLLLLMCMSDDHICKVFEFWKNDIDKVTAWLEGLIYMSPSLWRCNKFIKFAAHAYEAQRPQFYMWIQQLVETSSNALPYLSVGLSPVDFTALIELEVDYGTDLLFQLLPKKRVTALKILTQIYRDDNKTAILFQNFAFKINSELADTLTFMEVKNYIIQASAGNQIGIYHPIIFDIPPFLIALAMLNSDHRKWLISVGAYLTDDQLKAMAWCFSLDHVFEEMDTLAKIVRNDQFMVLMKELPTKKKRRYLVDKASSMAVANKNVSDLDEQVQIEINNLGRLKNQLNESKYKQLHEKTQKQMSRLYGMCRAFSSPEYLILKKATIEILTVRPKLESKLGSIPVIMDIMEKRLENFRGSTGYFNQIEALKPDFELEEEEISPFYWEFIKAQSLVHLRVLNSDGHLVALEHPGKLLDLGIRSDEDFKLLGISEDNLIELDKLCTEVNKFASSDLSERAVLINKMNQIAPEFPTEINPSTDIDLNVILSPDKITTDALKEASSTLLETAVKVPLIEVSHRNFLLELDERLILEKDPNETRKCCIEMWNLITDVLKGYGQQKQLQIHHWWENVLHLGLKRGTDRFAVESYKLIKLLNISSSHIQGLQTILNELLHEGLLFSLDDTQLENTGKQLILKGKEDMENPDLTSWELVSLAHIIEVIKANSFLGKLQRYLKQPELKKLWGEWHASEIYTVRDLVKYFNLEEKRSTLFELSTLRLPQDDSQNASSSSSPNDDDKGLSN